MKKRLTSFFLVLALSFSLSLPAFALDDNNYYSLPSVGGSEPFVSMVWPVNRAGFSTDDSRVLTEIYKVIQYLYLSPSSWQRNSVIGFLERILDAIPSNLSTNFGLRGGDGTNDMLDDVRKWTMFTYNSLTSDSIAGNLGNIMRNTLSTADGITKSNTLSGNISDSVSALNRTFTPTLTSSYSDSLFSRFSVSNGEVSLKNASFGYLMTYLLSAVSVDLPFTGSGGSRTLYGFVSDLANTLASEDDRQLAQNYQENRDEAEKDFLTGQTGPTSLGKGDFSNASQVGGALNDTFNMGGAAKVSDFLSGFGSAGSESQAWFSQTTANNLNSVEASDVTSGVSSFADDGQSMVDVDPDPYNMVNIFERYEWLEGVCMDG